VPRNPLAEYESVEEDDAVVAIEQLVPRDLTNDPPFLRYLLFHTFELLPDDDTHEVFDGPQEEVIELFDMVRALRDDCIQRDLLGDDDEGGDDR